MPFQRRIRSRRQEFTNAPKCRFCPVTSCNQLYSTRSSLERHLVTKHGYTDAAAKVKADLNNGMSDNANTNLARGGEDRTVEQEKGREQEESKRAKSPSPLNSSFSPFPSTLSTTITTIPTTTTTPSSSHHRLTSSFSTSTSTSSPICFSPSAARAKQCRQCRSLIGHTSRNDLQKFHGGDGNLLKTVIRRELRCQAADCRAWFARPTELAEHWIRFHREMLLASQAEMEVEMRAAEKGVKEIKLDDGSESE